MGLSAHFEQFKYDFTAVWLSMTGGAPSGNMHLIYGVIAKLAGIMPHDPATNVGHSKFGYRKF